MDIAAESARAWQAFAAGRHAEAADGAARVLREAPADPGALTLRARLLLAGGEPVAADELIRALLKRFPEMAALWIDLAFALRELGRHEEAVKALERAIGLEPRNAAAWVRLGQVRLNFGEPGAAAEAFRRALDAEPGHVAALRGLGLAGAIEPESGLAEQVRKLASAPQTRPTDAAGLHFALAQGNRRAGRREAFIRHLLAANAIQRSISPAGRAEYAEMYDRLEAAFSREAFAAAARAAPTAPRPVFILGMPRSGTTLLERVIAKHPDVRAGGEIDYMRRPLRHAMERLTGQLFPRGFETVPSEAMTTMAESFARRIDAIGQGAPFVTDKTPDNYHVLGLLRLLFPEGPIVHVTRDPMDTCFSILQYQFEDRSPHTCDMELLAYAFARHLRLMQRWREIFGDGFITVRYEDFVASPAAEGRRTCSALKVRRPIYRTSVGAWREFEAELEPLRLALESEGVPT